MNAQMLQEAESGEKNRGVTGEKFGLFSRKGKEGKWVVELLLKGESRGSFCVYLWQKETAQLSGLSPVWNQ